MTDPCTVDQCGRPVFAVGLCRGHYDRRRRGAEVNVELRPWGKPSEAVVRASLHFANVEGSELDFHRAKKRLLMASRRLKKG